MGTNYEIDYSNFTISYGNNQKAVFQNDSNFVIYDRNKTVICAFGNYGAQMISPSLQARSENPYYDSTLEMRNTASGHGNAYAFISDDNHPNDYQQFGMVAKNIGEFGVVVARNNFSQYSKWAFNGDQNTLVSPNQNPYPEVIGMGNTRRVVIQTFVATFSTATSNGQYTITFPQAFASNTTPTVFFQIDFETGTNNNVTRTVNLTPSNAINNASVNIIISDPSFSQNEITNAAINNLQVVAIGYI